MGLRSRSNSFDSPKLEVGEIDTRAPFSSVRAAVSLFGEVAFSGDKSSGRKQKPSTPKSSNSSQEPRAFLVTETQLHLAQKELHKFREQLQNAETTREEALVELDRAKKAVTDLTAKLVVINESKELALKASEAAKTQSNQFKEDLTSGSEEPGQLELDQSREQYAAAIAQLDAAKQELRSMRKEFEALVEAKISACNRESEAKYQSKENAAKADLLSKEIEEVQESLTHVKLATEQAQEEESKIRSEKESTRNSYRLALEEAEGKLASLKKEFDPQLNKELESKLAETDAEINAVRSQLEGARSSALESVNSVTAELEEAKGVLQKVAGEETSIRNSVESLKLELAAAMKEHNDLKEKDAEAETLISDLHVKLQNCKAELEAAAAAESKASLASAELMTALQQLQSESESALREAEAMRKEAEVMRSEAEAAKATLSETEKKLAEALKEVEAAKAAEAQALDEIKTLSAKASADRSSTSAEPGAAAEIMISKEEYESLSHKVEESEKLTEMKVAAAAAQVEAVKASEAEAAKRLEAVLKEIEEMEAAREDALKRAEMAEAAKTAVEGELSRWREKEQKRAAEVAASEEGAVSMEAASSPGSSSKPPVGNADVSDGGRKINRTLGASKKSSLLPNLSGIFHRKKNSADGGTSLFHGEKEKHV